MVSNERLSELLVIYNNLKARIMVVDDKYSLQFHEPQLDLPESLGLVKMVYTPKTDAELTGQAAVQAEAEYSSKRRQIDASYASSCRGISTKRANLVETVRKKNAAYLADYNSSCDSLLKRLIDNGLLFSTVKERAQQEELDKYNAKVDELNLSAEAQSNTYDSEQNNVNAGYEKQCADLEIEKNKKIEIYFNKLKTAQEKEKREVFRYNAQVDEKEAKYKASREKALEAARKTEYDRIYKMSKIYAEFGEAGVAARVRYEKLMLTEQTFLPLNKEECNAIMSYDGFLRSHLGNYYDSLVDWVNSKR